MHRTTPLSLLMKLQSQQVATDKTIENNFVFLATFFREIARIIGHKMKRAIGRKQKPEQSLPLNANPNEHKAGDEDHPFSDCQAVGKCANVGEGEQTDSPKDDQTAVNAGASQQSSQHPIRS